MRREREKINIDEKTEIEDGRRDGGRRRKMEIEEEEERRTMNKEET